MSQVILNTAILGAPFLLVRLFCGAFFPGAIIGITPLVLWYAIGFGCRPLAVELAAEQRFYLWVALCLISFAGAGSLAWHNGLRLPKLPLVYVLNAYTWLCAFYYGGLQFTGK